ncbi:hypothetical protein [Dyella sp. C9]|uniref:hypothetical protein n=1 Tax=Dyella sp. C9 TaxID=2202154 RepID=UPI000DEF2B41|nr:hypothetical protein [Dyella sp. C9]
MNINTAVYSVTEGPHGRWILYREGIAIGRDLQLGFAIQQALLLAHRENLEGHAGTRVRLVSNGSSYDLTH